MLDFRPKIMVFGMRFDALQWRRVEFPECRTRKNAQVVLVPARHTKFFDDFRYGLALVFERPHGTVDCDSNA